MPGGVVEFLVAALWRDLVEPAQDAGAGVLACAYRGAVEGSVALQRAVVEADDGPRRSGHCRRADRLAGGELEDVVRRPGAARGRQRGDRHEAVGRWRRASWGEAPRAGWRCGPRWRSGQGRRVRRACRPPGRWCRRSPCARRHDRRSRPVRPASRRTALRRCRSAARRVELGKHGGALGDTCPAAVPSGSIGFAERKVDVDDRC